jgi:hypothetical protein
MPVALAGEGSAAMGHEAKRGEVVARQCATGHLCGGGGVVVTVGSGGRRWDGVGWGPWGGEGVPARTSPPRRFPTSRVTQR